MIFQYLDSMSRLLNMLISHAIEAALHSELGKKCSKECIESILSAFWEDTVDNTMGSSIGPSGDIVDDYNTNCNSNGNSISNHNSSCDYICNNSLGFRRTFKPPSPGNVAYYRELNTHRYLALAAQPNFTPMEIPRTAVANFGTIVLMTIVVSWKIAKFNKLLALILTSNPLSQFFPYLWGFGYN